MRLGFLGLLALLGLLCILWTTPAQAQAMCNATTPTPGTPGVCAGNPLNVLTGNKFQVEVDMPALPGVLGLELVRYYNSEDSGPEGARGILGRGWRLSYDAELQIAGRTITLIQADGTTHTYTTINGRSVLAQIDGPLKNGPKNSPQDSDITAFAYDKRASYQLPTGDSQPVRLCGAGRCAQ